MIIIGWITLVLAVMGLLINLVASMAGYKLEWVEKEEENPFNGIASTIIALGIKGLGIWWIYQMVTAL